MNQYIGRFAPSPTGPLHLGSLVAAMASYADCLQHQGRWLLRIEDVDAPRCSPDSEHLIHQQLNAYGFRPHGDVLRQSERTARYDRAMSQLIEDGHIYACRCTRKMLADAPRNSEGDLIYPSTCTSLHVPVNEPHATLRFAVAAADTVFFVDRAFGLIEQNVSSEVGDFVVRRSDGLYAYQLAVVVDDADQGVTQVVRGADLLGNTARQILLQQALGVATPRYLHVPLVCNDAGEKLSKQTRAEAISTNSTDILSTLEDAWQLLQQDSLDHPTTVAEFWQRAAAAWQVARLSVV
ncbi:MAG: tRNA glutamyl-Q(34) synthetase GluQRS [Betaproteobacteria bacterium]|nr:MAG: tRNA glutamyl-Q(34) synthetase GluQRS [Betaproteobacteria bacterium]TAG45537.1 MAG: tRNA glutamyl-Q(34) synthetase GluQRS [Betaproteobacteria bacterium]